MNKSPSNPHDELLVNARESQAPVCKRVYNPPELELHLP